MKIGDKIQLDDKEDENVLPSTEIPWNDTKHDVHEKIRDLLNKEATSITLNLIGIKDHEARPKLEDSMRFNLSLKFYNQIPI